MLKTFKQLSLDDIQLIKTIETVYPTFMQYMQEFDSIKDLQEYCESKRGAVYLSEDMYLIMCPQEVVGLESLLMYLMLLRRIYFL